MSIRGSFYAKDFSKEISGVEKYIGIDYSDRVNDFPLIYLKSERFASSGCRNLAASKSVAFRLIVRCLFY